MKYIFGIWFQLDSNKIYQFVPQAPTDKPKYLGLANGLAQIMRQAIQWTSDDSTH